MKNFTWKRIIVSCISFMLSFLLIYLLLKNINISNIFTTIIQIKPKNYFWGLLLYISSCIFRTLRLSYLLKIKISIKVLYVTCIHSFVNQTLPFRIGEISLPFLMKKANLAGYSESLPSIFIMRIIDIIVLVSFFLIALTILLIKIKMDILFWVVVFLMISIIVFINKKKIYVNLMKFLFKFFPERYKPKYQFLIDSANTIFKMSFKKVSILFLYSFADRILNIAMSIFIVRGLFYVMSINSLISANIVSSFTEVLPINSIGSFGTLELGWVGALIYSGATKEVAISSGFQFHIIGFSFTILCGIISIIGFFLCIQKLSPKKNSLDKDNLI